MSYLYIISLGHAGRGYKIGRSIDPEKRVVKLQTGNPDTLSLEVKYPIPIELAAQRETLCKAALAPLQVRGEMFLCQLSLLSHIVSTVASSGEIDDFILRAIDAERLGHEVIDHNKMLKFKGRHKTPTDSERYHQSDNLLSRMMDDLKIEFPDRYAAAYEVEGRWEAGSGNHLIRTMRRRMGVA